MNAVELLTAFSGESAKQYESLFRFTEDSGINGVEIHAAGMKNTIARYSGQDQKAWYEVNNILRISTADGFEGISGVDTYSEGRFSDAHLRELRTVADDLVAFRSLDPVEVSLLLDEKRPDVSNEVRASIDIALWDLAAKKAGRRVFDMLGASRESITPYASLPFYESLPEYIDAVNRYAKLGYTVFKFHVWGTLEKDLALVQLVQQTFAGSQYRFMIDLESVYDYDDALRLGRQMDEGLFVWLEAPIDDALLAQYAELRRELETHIIPAGYTVYSPEFIRRGIELGAWDAARFDVTVVGGLTKALELMIIAKDAGLTVDIQSWGHTLAQSANLQLMLANSRTRYFEAPMPKEVFEFGMKNGNLLHGDLVVPPAGPGLGIEVDWDQLATADFYGRIDLDYAGATVTNGGTDADKPFLLTYPNLDNPNGRVVLSNEHVVLQRLVVAPGEWEGIHSHPGNQIYVHIKGGEWSGRLDGEVEYTGIVSPDGEVGWMDSIPLSAGHDSGNTGDTPIDLIYVTRKSDQPIAPDVNRSPQTYPDITTELLLDNDLMIVQRLRLEPGQWTGVHGHPGIQVAIHISGGTWSLRHNGTLTASSQVSAAGSVRWFDPVDLSAGHDFGNTGDTALELVLVTLR